jgi:hypothetical protein
LDPAFLFPGEEGFEDQRMLELFAPQELIPMILQHICPGSSNQTAHEPATVPSESSSDTPTITK